MFHWLFGSRNRARRAIIDALYEAIVAASRQPVFYARSNVPDTPLGRFEMLALHMILVLRRLQEQKGAKREVAQELTDLFFQHVESGIRELGIGDMGVPKRIKKLARMFYGRAQTYGKALDTEDAAGLADAIRRNVWPKDDNGVGDDELARYMLAAETCLKEQPDDDLLAGQIRFPDANRLETAP